MPLLDHFHRPLTRTHSWRSFHSAWATAIASHLNEGILPPGFYPVPNVDLDGPLEIDVAALRERLSESAPGTDLALWSPAEPTLSVVLDFPPLDLIEVQVLYDEDTPRLTAAIELVSPSSKDRPSQRRAFTLKCLSYLHQGSAVVVVDAVTSRQANFHAEILALLGHGNGTAWHSPTGLYAVAYRVAGADDQKHLQAWTEPLVLGGPLPLLPLWLGVDLCVPLDLEPTYQATCANLRVPRAG